MIPVQLIVAGVIAAASFAGAWSIQANRYDKTISDIHAQQALALAAATKEAHDTTLRLQQKLDASQKAAAVRQSALARDLAANRDALSRLHNASDSALRRASDSHEACIAVSAAQGDVLNQCSARLVEVGEAADRHASSVQTLEDSWPKE